VSTTSFSKNIRIDISLNWQHAVDLDLLAIYETKNENFGIIYYANQGDLDKFPYIKIAEDEGVDQEDGDYEESLTITKIDPEIKYIWICTWNYQKVLDGHGDDMENHQISTEVIIPMSHQHKRISIPLDLSTGNKIGESNFIALCVLDCHQKHNSQEFELKNLSAFHQLKSLNSIEIVSFLKRIGLD
jgi:hypothetical protein